MTIHLFNSSFKVPRKKVKRTPQIETDSDDQEPLKAKDITNTGDSVNEDVTPANSMYRLQAKKGRTNLMNSRIDKYEFQPLNPSTPPMRTTIAICPDDDSGEDKITAKALVHPMKNKRPLSTTEPCSSSFDAIKSVMERFQSVKSGTSPSTTQATVERNPSTSTAVTSTDERRKPVLKTSSSATESLNQTRKVQFKANTSDTSVMSSTMKQVVVPKGVSNLPPASKLGKTSSDNPPWARLFERGSLGNQTKQVSVVKPVVASQGKKVTDKEPLVASRGKKVSHVEPVIRQINPGKSQVESQMSSIPPRQSNISSFFKKPQKVEKVETKVKLQTVVAPTQSGLKNSNPFFKNPKRIETVTKDNGDAVPTTSAQPISSSSPEPSQNPSEGNSLEQQDENEAEMDEVIDLSNHKVSFLFRSFFACTRYIVDCPLESGREDSMYN